MIPAREWPKASIHFALRFLEPGIRAVGHWAQLESVPGCLVFIGGFCSCGAGIKDDVFIYMSGSCCLLPLGPHLSS